MEVKPRDEEISKELNFYIKLRWVLALAGPLVLYLVTRVGNFNFHLKSIFLLSFFVLGYNLLCFLYSQKRGFKSLKSLRRFAHLQISLDFFSLSILVHLTGGPESPWALFFIFSVIGAAFLLSSRASFFYAGLSFFLYLGIVAFQYFGFLPHRHWSNFSHPYYNTSRYIFGQVGLFGGILFFATYFVSRFARRLKKRQERLDAFLEVSKIGRETLDLKVLLGKILDKVLPLVKAPLGAVFLLDEEGFLRLKAGRGISSETIRNTRLKIGEGLAGEAAASEKIVISENLPEDSRAVPLFFKELEPQTQISLPLKGRDRLVGVLSLATLERHHYRKGEINFLTSVSDRIASAIDNARFFEKMERKMAELSVLFEAGKVINSTLELRKILELSLDSVLELLQAEQGSIMLWDEKLKELTIGAARGLKEEIIERAKVKEGEGISGQVIATGEPKLITNGFKESSSKNQVSSGEIRSALCVPLKAKEKILGVLNVSEKASGIFTSDDLDLLCGLANQAAMALENALLFEIQKKEAEQIAVVNKASRLISSSLNIEEIYSALVSSLRKLIEFERVSISLLNETRSNVESFTITNRGEVLEKKVVKPTEVCCATWIIEHKKPLLRGDLRKTPWFRTDHIIIEQGIKTCLSLPLMAKDKILGTFCLYHKNLAAYSREDVKVLEPIAEQLAIAVENAKLYQDLRQGLIKTVETLAKAVEAKDPFTAGHSERVARYALAVAQELGFSGEELEGLEMAARLHDIGKIGIAEGILLKPGKLTAEEKEVVMRHPGMGTTILTPLNFSEEIMGWIRHHHEQPDGRGYPDRLSQKRISLGASILRVADAFEAMTSDRPYRQALSLEEAFLELERYAGIQFEKEIVNIFLRVFRKAPLKAVL